MKKTLDILAIMLAVVMMSALLYCTSDSNAQVITNPTVTGVPAPQSNVAITGGTINGTSIGGTTPAAGAFTTISATGQFTSTLSTGTAPFVIASTTQVANLNAATAGSATNTNNVNLANDTANATDYLIFTNTATGNQPLKTNTGISVNPSTAAITATTFSGALSGNATTATTATNATNITTTDDTSTNTTYYPTFQTATGGTNPLKTSSTKLTYNPSTGVLASTGLTLSGLGANGVLSTDGSSALQTQTTQSSYTPTIGDGTNNFTTSVALGRYYKIGPMYFITVQLTWTGKGSAGAGSALVISLPVTQVSSVSTSVSVGYDSGIGFTGNTLTAGVLNNTNVMTFYGTSIVGVQTQVTVAQATATGSIIASLVMWTQ